MPGRTRWGDDDWSFGELLRYRSPKGLRNTLVLFVSVKDDDQAVVVTKDMGRMQTVPLAQLKRDSTLRPKVRAELRLVEIDDSVDTHALEIRFRRHWKRLASFVGEAGARPIRAAVIAALRAVNVEV